MKKQANKIMIGSIVVGLIVLTICIILFKNKQWDSIELYYRNLENKIELTQKQEKELADLIWNYEFQAKESGTVDGLDEMKYGGTMLWVKFEKGDVQYSWQLTEEYTVYSVFENGVEIDAQVYAGDKDLITEIKRTWIKTTDPT